MDEKMKAIDDELPDELVDAVAGGYGLGPHHQQMKLCERCHKPIPFIKTSGLCDECSAIKGRPV